MNRTSRNNQRRMSEVARGEFLSLNKIHAALVPLRQALRVIIIIRRWQKIRSGVHKEAACKMKSAPARLSPTFFNSLKCLQRELWEMCPF